MKRRLLSTVVAGIMGAMLVACGSASEPTEVTEITEASQETPLAAASADESVAADVQAIVDRGVLRVGVKNAVVGFGYEDPLTGEYTGMEIELAKALADKLGVDVEFTAVTAATRTELLDSGDIDCVLATFTITDERSKGIKTLDDLADATVGVSSGSTSAKALVKAMIEKGLISGDGFDEESFDPATWTDGIKFQQYDDYPTISTALSAGEVDAFCVDKSILAIYKTEGRSYIDAEFSPQNYGIATTKGSGLSKVAEDLVTESFDNGTIAKLVSENGLD